jgi:HD-GYP domain-containing protein (c-di-GMP phosphodiesterase class II)
MTETQELLSKIAALRQRLDQARGLASEADSAVLKLLGGDGATLLDLRRRVDAGSAHDANLDTVLKPVEGGTDAVTLPRQFTARARMLLERGKDLLARLRGLDEILSPDVPESRTDTRAVVYRQTVALTTTALRSLAFLPDTATAQLPLCEGPSAILDVVAARLRTLEASVQLEDTDRQRVERLAHALQRVEQGREENLEPFISLASELLTQAEECLPLSLLEEDPSASVFGFDTSIGPVAEFVATHGLNVASVVARVARYLPAFRQRVIEPVIVALLLDVGVLRVPASVLATPAPLPDEVRRVIERHTRDGEEMVRPLSPDASWLAQAVLQHHERLDGTGYPDGLCEPQIDPVARLLAVCDVYVSLASRRPYRPACEPRTAMTDTLLLADQGLLDREFAEALLQLSFYPVGTMVELADGAVGVVAAIPTGRSELTNPAKPVVLLLLDGQGTPLAIPRHLDLGQAEGHSIVRSLTPAERRHRIGRHFPEWA